MLTEPTRWRARPPEVDAMLVAPDTADSACLWLRAYDRDGFLTGDGVRVTTSEHGPGFDVPHGHYLVRDVATGQWAPIPSEQLPREYEPQTAEHHRARHAARTEARRG